jgi:hypothetical protein
MRPLDSKDFIWQYRPDKRWAMIPTAASGVNKSRRLENPCRGHISIRKSSIGEMQAAHVMMIMTPEYIPRIWVALFSCGPTARVEV